MENVLSGNIKIVGDNFVHIVNVLRHKVGDNIVLCDNVGINYSCKIIKIDKSSLTVEIVENLGVQNEPLSDVCLAVASLKADKLELVTQKISELGLNRLIIFNSKFCEKPAVSQRIERLHKIAVEATKQCGRSKILAIEICENLKTLCNQLKDYSSIILAYEKSNLPLQKAIKKIDLSKTAIIIGSEGGFEQSEVDFLLTQLPQLKIVSLGSRILRAETACIALSSIIMYESDVKN